MFDGTLENICVVGVNIMFACKPYSLFQIYLYNFQRDFLINANGFNSLFKSNAGTFKHGGKSISDFPINRRRCDNSCVFR
ncbi:MAG: hypothetical protein HFACDABA_00465 [Anaerolineales bacterium]|nr:hypothetical protein [Anaerolineales bacterium]